MTRSEFDTALDRFGGDLSRWPPEMAAAAEALVARDPAAAAGLRAARRLDELLAEAAAPGSTDAALIGRIVARRRASRREAELKPTGRLAGWAAAAAALMLMTGFAAGAVVPPDDSSEVFAEMIFSGSDEDISGELL